MAFGITLSVSFTYDEKHNVTGARIHPQFDPSAAFIGSPAWADPVWTHVRLPDANPPADLLGPLSIDLQSFTDPELGAMQKALPDVPNPNLRGRLGQAILEEQARRQEEEQRKAREAEMRRLRESNK